MGLGGVTGLAGVTALGGVTGLAGVGGVGGVVPLDDVSTPAAVVVEPEVLAEPDVLAEPEVFVEPEVVPFDPLSSVPVVLSSVEPLSLELLSSKDAGDPTNRGTSVTTRLLTLSTPTGVPTELVRFIALAAPRALAATRLTPSADAAPTTTHFFLFSMCPVLPVAAPCGLHPCSESGMRGWGHGDERSLIVNHGAGQCE